MDTSYRGPDLHNDTRINVATLLQEHVGAFRTYELDLAVLPLAEDLDATEVRGTIKLTRLRNAILVDGAVDGTAVLECVRCLNAYAQPFATTFTEEYRQMVDVRSGTQLNQPRGEEPEELDEIFTISENHELDLAESLRQWILLALPMRPDCGELCPGPPPIAGQEPEAAPSKPNPFAALSELLTDEQETEDGE